MLSAVLSTVGTTILGITLVQLANGFLGTLVSMNTASAGFAPVVVGVVLAAYYGGYTIGAATIATVLQRVGHIRLFAALAGLVAASIALQPILTSPGSWILIRLVTGFGAAGLFITAESWLNATSTPKDRGMIFAIYMVATNAAFGAGQFLLNLPAPGGFELFSLAAALFCLALVPVALTGSAQPKLVESPRLRLRDLRRLAPVSFAGCATTGLASSAFYSLVPAYAQTQGVEASSISAFMATAIAGGLAFQIPVGTLSDRFDRRILAGCIAAGLAISTLCLALLPLSTPVILIVTFILGGFMSTIYPVCVAHANDRVEPERAVATSGRLILIQGIASFLGPIIGTTVMGQTGIEGVYVYMSLVAMIFVAAVVWRVKHVEAPVQKERPFVILTERMSQPISHMAEEEDIGGESSVDAPKPQRSS
ncbi:MFS transporter [Rhodobacter sphaeroides]|uniref:MFS transporter n=1 Tax=Cereibacter sphaeroides TaxID=1063 RepID=UPI001323C0C3|nr:MFS transporter [Cereibacter sphaeroides]MWP38473.1 MFS transporter [Cereibacter sphaeroides]